MTPAQIEVLALERSKREQAVERSTLAAMQENDREHPTLRKAFTADQLADLHQREKYSALQAQKLGMIVLDAVYGDAAAVGAQKPNLQATRHVLRDYVEERSAIRRHITLAKRALDPTSIEVYRPTAKIAGLDDGPKVRS